jgi:DNA-directed RNA polymerase II subunit RPB2
VILIAIVGRCLWFCLHLDHVRDMPVLLCVQYTYIIKFSQVSVCLPVIYEADGESRELYPHEARLRGLTYSSLIYINVTSAQYQLDEHRRFSADDAPVKFKELESQFLGYVPIMLR